MKLLVVIPAYNEAGTIKTVVEELIEKCSWCDYIVINDGSSDDTSKICHENHFNIIDLPVNLGLSGAYSTGMKYAYINGYDAVLQFDADGQHMVEYIKPIYDAYCQGNYDILIGSRFVDKKKPQTLRMFGSNLISFAIKVTTGIRISDPTSGMRLWGRKMIREFAKEINITPEPDTVSYLIKRGAKVAEIQVEMRERIAGESYLNFYRSMIYMVRILISILMVQIARGKSPLYDI